jgi:hypothetical protein
MTARSHETIRVGLRRIIRDASVDPKARLEAIKLLMKVEGLMEAAWVNAPTQHKPFLNQMSEANAKRLEELLAAEQERKTG